MTLPSRGRLNADFDLGAADLNVNQARFPRAGYVYQSPDFDSAANEVDITIDAGAAGIKIR